MGKTVYILGAGFSIEAGAPTQERLVEQIFETNQKYPFEFEENSMEEFKQFLSDTLNIPERFHTKIPLEDIFTPLDRASLDNITFRNLSPEEVKKVRRNIYYLISKTLDILLKNSRKEYIDSFAQQIVLQSSKKIGHAYKNDTVSVISTNWDILLDNSIKKILDHNHLNPMGVVDYCCHISSNKEHDTNIKPGLEALGRGGFNVKLLKLHGSLNWLQCPRCQRLYIDFYKKISVDPNSDCRHCNKNFGYKPSHKLASNLIMPTFLKDLSNPQYKLIWQNAGIELSEADEIVFIGYSLPAADFEMRQLLSRMVRDNANITVVDYGSEDSQSIKSMQSRYQVFFGSRNINFYLKGAKNFMLEKFS